MKGLFASGNGLFGAPTASGGTGTGSPVLENSPTINTPNIVGVTNGSNAAAGSVGEVITGTLASGSARAMTSGSSKDFTNIILTPGQWNINAVGIFTGAGIGLGANLILFIGTTAGNSTTGQDTAKNTAYLPAATTGSNISATINYKVNISSTTTYYLKGNVDTANISAYGTIQAERSR